VKKSEIWKDSIEIVVTHLMLRRSENTEDDYRVNWETYRAMDIWWWYLDRWILYQPYDGAISELLHMAVKTLLFGCFHCGCLISFTILHSFLLPAEKDDGRIVCRTAGWMQLKQYICFFGYVLFHFIWKTSSNLILKLQQLIILAIREKKFPKRHGSLIP